MGTKHHEENRLHNHEELVQPERVLREAQVRSIHEMEDLKRAQEMRTDEFARHELRQSHAAIHGLTSQIQDLQERKNYMNDSRELQDIESICSGKLSHVPSQPTVVPSSRAMSSRDQSLRPETWNSSGTHGIVCGNPRAVIDSSQTPHQGILHSWNQSAAGGNTRVK